jgi:hypothetical protein
MMSVTIKSIILNVIMMNVITLNVVAPLNPLKSLLSNRVTRCSGDSCVTGPTKYSWYYSATQKVPLELFHINAVNKQVPCYKKFFLLTDILSNIKQRASNTWAKAYVFTWVISCIVKFTFDQIYDFNKSKLEKYSLSNFLL